jgi:hypothetical protein
MQLRLFGRPVGLAIVTVLFVLASSPAFGQGADGDTGATPVTGGKGSNPGDDVQYDAICQNILGSIGDISQGQTGNANVASDRYSEAVAEVAQEQGVSLEQINACLNGASDTGTDTTGTDNQDDVLASTIPDQKVLANTGGPALFLPALGLLLIFSIALRSLLRR